MRSSRSGAESKASVWSRDFRQAQGDDKIVDGLTFQS
jgi:hypothetical protein